LELAAAADSTDDSEEVKGSGPRTLAELLADPPDEPWAEPARRLHRLFVAARTVLDEEGTVEDALWAVWSTSGLAEHWERIALAGGERGAAADRDLDAVVALFAIAGQFTDRLPGAGVRLFLDHLLGQELPGDYLAPTAARGETVQILTAHSAKGQEWDVVVVAGVQEGIWPNLKPRGSLLGSELLVDVAEGRPSSGVVALLEEERRLFYVAATRARRRLIVTAVASREEEPSRFLDELRVRSESPERTVVEYARLPPALTLSGLVAELRLKVIQSEEGREDAARQLAVLAEAGVAGAHPDEWWGLRGISDDRPLTLPGERTRVSPSTVETVLNCGLRWILGRHGGDSISQSASIGTLVHFAAELSAQDGVTRTDILDEVRRRFAMINPTVAWYTERQWREVEKMIDRLLSWVDDRQGRLIGVERDFRVDMGGGVELVGRVDRLERDEYGRLVIIDFKTGKSSEDAECSKQLAAYQAAVEAGAFPEGNCSGGAALVRLRLNALEKWQPPLSEATDPGWAAALVRDAGAVLGGATVLARVGEHCRPCPVKVCCPLHSAEVMG
jgi:ATP-dependent exoDNAse (exonuclease V) beta subunit